MIDPTRKVKITRRDGNRKGMVLVAAGKNGDDVRRREKKSHQKSMRGRRLKAGGKQKTEDVVQVARSKRGEKRESTASAGKTESAHDSRRKHR